MNKSKNYNGFTNEYKKSVSKRTGIGEDAELLEKQKIKELKFKDNMEEYIKALIKKAKITNGIPNLQFYVIHVNVFYSYKEDIESEAKFHPAEIAIAEFSLKKGVTRVYNQIINREIRKGYQLSAAENSKNTHQIPLNFQKGKNDYQEIFEDIYEFLKPGLVNGKLPPIYTSYFKEDFFLPAKFFLDTLAISAGKPEDFFLLYSFEEIFSTIFKSNPEIPGADRMDSVTAVVLLKKDTFEYNMDLACDHHIELGGGQNFCSLSFVKRWIFELCKHCCEAFDIKIIAGLHKPQDSFLLNSIVCSTRFNDNRIRPPVSMTGVSDEYREIVSQRSYKDEIRRREEAKHRPIEIIDHSKIFRKPEEVRELPLRRPCTKSMSSFFDDPINTESLDFINENRSRSGRAASVNKKSG